MKSRTLAVIEVLAHGVGRRTRIGCLRSPSASLPRRLRISPAPLILLGLSLFVCSSAARQAALDQGWENPSLESRLRAYWWWLNGNVTREAITRDLEEMKAKGFGGALICDAGGAEQDGNDRVPHGPTFFTPEWRELYKYALREAQRLGLEMSLNIQSGWNLGGPMVTAEDAAKRLTWSETLITGPGDIRQPLPNPKIRDGYYREAFAVAYKLNTEGTNRPLQNWEQKAVHKALHFSAPDTTPLFQEYPAETGDPDTTLAGVVDLSSNVVDGVLNWRAPEGTWRVLRLGYTIGDRSRVSTCSDGWQGYALDVLDASAFQRYWDAVVEPLLADAGPLAGKTLKYLHTDSWEVEPLNWTPNFREEFRKRRGYDLISYLPALAGRVVENRRLSNRFLHDFRKTLGDLAIDNHYRPFRDLAHRHGLQIHPESGGPHAVPIDAQRCLGMDDAPMSEFWAWSWRHRVGDQNRFFVKQPASAAHTYGHRLVLAEGFTTIGPHWQERVWDNLKPSFDKAVCEGLNLLVWHAFVCSPESMGLPGQQYFAGTHFNPNSTWWQKSAPFLSYINRCQFLQQQGLFVADVCCYYGDHVPNFAQLKRSDPARILPGYDYDVITEEAILTRLSVMHGRLVLPDGMSYRVLVLPERRIISLPVLRKLKELIAGGATVIGPRPEEASGLAGFPECDTEVAQIAAEIWADCDGRDVRRHRYGQGRVYWNQPVREVLSASGVLPDFEVSSSDSGPAIDYVHRRAEGADIYFVANRSNRVEQAICTFRVEGRAPEIWDAVSGERRFAAAYSIRGGRTTLPLELPPCGSLFVIFREPAGKHPPTRQPSTTTFETLAEITGPWQVRFDPKFGGPGDLQFEALEDWTKRPEEGIRFYSGTARYSKPFEARKPGRGKKVWIDLGVVHELAEVHLNGVSLGVVWAAPFRIEATGQLKDGANLLEIEVVNFWPNRIIGDSTLPPEKRLTRTNIRKLTKETPLMESGLLGPVRLLKSDGK